MVHIYSIMMSLCTREPKILNPPRSSDVDMAGLFQVPKNALAVCRAACVSVIQVRTYALKYKQPKEESRELARFRRAVQAKRKEFSEEWREEQRLKLEAEGAQAAEEARMERLQEERALDENRKELERMAEKRQVLSNKRPT